MKKKCEVESKEKDGMCPFKFFEEFSGKVLCANNTKEFKHICVCIEASTQFVIVSRRWKATRLKGNK